MLQYNTQKGKFRSIPLKDYNFRYISYQCYLTYMWGTHESMTCGANDIYLKLQSFNGIDPVIPKKPILEVS